MADYSSIGKKTSQSLTDIYKTTQQNSLAVNQIVNQSNNIRTGKRKAALNANQKLHKKGFEAYALKQEVDARRKNNEDVKNIEAPSKRFAGLVSGLGLVSAGAISIKDGIQKRKEDAALEAQFDALRKEERASQDERDTKQAEIFKKLEDLLKQPSTLPSTPSATSAKTTTQGSTTSGSKVSSNPNVGFSTGSTLPISSSYSLPNTSEGWSRLSKVIRYGEGTSGDKGYTTRYGGHQFEGFDAHPNIGEKTPWGTTSEAAGAFQFMKPTWDRAQKALNLPDFSPESQEKAGRYLTEIRGVNPDKVITSKEEFKAVMDKLAPEWASLPFSSRSPSGYGMGSSYYGQGGKNIDELWSLYNS